MKLAASLLICESVLLQSLVLLTHVDGDHPGQRCRLAPCVDDNAGWTSVDLMLPLQCVKASLDQFGRKTLNCLYDNSTFQMGHAVNTKSPEFREVMPVLSLCACLIKDQKHLLQLGLCCCS